MKYTKLLFPLLVLVTALSIINCSNVLDPDKPGNLVPKTVTDDPLLPFLEVNGTKLHLESFGDINDPIIIFLHGGPGGDYRAMISQIDQENASRYPDERTITNGGISQLQDEYFCVFYDQRGAGLSPRFDSGEVEFDDYVSDLNAVIDHFLLEKQNITGIVETQVYLFGWSFGGILATGFINEHPEKVKDVVLYESGPLSADIWDYFIENSTSVFDQLDEDWLNGYLLSLDHISANTHERADYQKLLGAFRSKPEFHENPNTPLWRLGVFIGKENIDFKESDDYDIASNIATSFQGRLLFLGGELTMQEYPDYAQMQTAFYPLNQIIIINGVGHTGVWEKPTEISDIIRDFMSQ